MLRGRPRLCAAARATLDDSTDGSTEAAAAPPTSMRRLISNDRFIVPLSDSLRTAAHAARLEWRFARTGSQEVLFEAHGTWICISRLGQAACFHSLDVIAPTCSESCQPPTRRQVLSDNVGVM